MIENIEKKITNVLENYFENIDLSFLSEDDEDSVKMAIDVEDIVSNIREALREHVFKFDTSSYGNYHCDSCQKMFGDFVSSNGATVQADEILKPNSTIILD